MKKLPDSIQNFIKILSQFPGIGLRQATRIAFWFFQQKLETKNSFLLSINEIIQKIGHCSECFFIMEKNKEHNLCSICSDSTRDKTTICVISKETDLITIEKTNKYHGLYHILGEMFSILELNKEKELTINALINRIKKNKIQEVILAINPTSEGNLTALHLESKLKLFNIKITRLARGIPTGGEIEFADAETLINALEGRK